MEVNWGTTYIDPTSLIAISRGDKTQMLKYLHQFQKLIPQRIASLKISLKAGDRKMTRQILHQMSPQLQFFGIPGVVDLIQTLELKYETMLIEDLKLLVNDILIKLDYASKEVEQVLKNHFE